MHPKINIVGVSKTYSSGGKKIQALDQVNLTIDHKDIFGIIGLSGAGKSTLIRCLATLVFPSSGVILFDGKDLSLLDKKQLRHFRQNIGMIFQHFNLLSSRTVAENIAYPLEIASLNANRQQERVDELLNLVGLSHKKHAYPSSLSGGEKQRVGIARALACEPQVLLCDEATSALDPKTTQEILTLLKSINQQLGVTIVLITHEMEVIQEICNKVAVIESGKIVEEGFVADVFFNPTHTTTKEFLRSEPHESKKDQKRVRLQFNELIETPVIELRGSEKELLSALNYFSKKTVNYEVLEHGH
ncbi:MAG: ATP-binding cassette domain-containing protein [Rhabdochlamydiaceae bacterium]|nr:ATP-binding cassette domain-containing protein [Rhabdochlamydiaceae bacterium]